MKILPKKIFMDDAIHLFGLTEHPRHQAIRIIHSYHQYDDLPMYFDNDIDHCKNATDKHYFSDDLPGSPGFIHFEEFSEKVVVPNNADMYDHTIYNNSKNKLFLESNFEHHKDTVTIAVKKFKSKDTDYYVTDCMGGRVMNIPIKPSDIYFDRDELVNFKYSSAENEPSNLSSKSKKPSQQSLRESAFTYWLIVTANLSGTDKGTLKEAYKLIGKPTQDTIWEALNKMDPKLFNKNKPEFFRELELITQELGTGIGRTSIKRQP